LLRGWDRLFATFVFERTHWALAFKPWIWISPDKDSGDNPDIDDYMGHGELRVVYGRNDHVFSAMARNQLESGFERGALELSWSFPVFDYPPTCGANRPSCQFDARAPLYLQADATLDPGIDAEGWHGFFAGHWVDATQGHVGLTRGVALGRPIDIETCPECGGNSGSSPASRIHR
jgi:hypothetical protein